ARAGTNSTGVVPDNVHARTLGAALRFYPSTERVFVINGTIERDKWAETVLKDQFREMQQKVTITYLTDYPLGKLLAKVKDLPDRSLIFYSRQDYEVPGASLSQFDVLALVANSAKVPIFTSGAYVGYGTIGGYTVNTFECGVQVANIALRIMNGAEP